MAAEGRQPAETDDALLAHFSAARPDVDAPPEFGPALRAALAAGRAAWPDVHLSAEPFVRFVAERLAEGRPAGPALAGLHASDLYLACACARGDKRALARLDALCAPLIDRSMARLRVPPDRAGDLRQQVRERLFAPRTGEGGRPKAPRIAGYSGRGPLLAWARAIAVHETLRLLKKGRREHDAEDEALAHEIGRDEGPELAYVKRLYRDEFKAAFVEAIEALSDRERTLLRQHALDGLTIDRLASLYRVHRATAARWVEAAREAVLDHTRRGLMRRLRLGPGEIDSVMRLLQSQLDVTLAPLLRERG